MMDCKAMTTPMGPNLKLLSVAASESVDATMYCQMIYSLMYLTNTRPDIFFAVNTSDNTSWHDMFTLVFPRSRFPPRGSDESVSHSNMVRGLVPSMVRCKCKDALI